MQQLFSSKILTICLSFVLATGCFFWQTVPASANTSAPTLIASLFSFSGDRPSNLGVKSGQLNGCPTSPNCVSSQSSDAGHKIEPLTYDSTEEKAIAQLKEIIEAIDNAKIIEINDNYLYVEFTSKLMGFVDDVEFYLDTTAAVIQVRSASRLGQSDLGVNRQRIEAIRTLMQG